MKDNESCGFNCWGDPIEVLYLSGPMTGYDDYNVGCFNQEATRLRELGYTVISPAEMDHADDNYGQEYYKVLKRDIIQMVAADALVLIPGAISSNSNGVLVEVQVASHLNLPILESAYIEDGPVQKRKENETNRSSDEVPAMRS